MNISANILFSRARRWCIAVAIAVAIAVLPACASAATTQPTTAPGGIEALEAALTLTDRERNMLAAVNDKVQQLTADPAFYVLLKRIAAITPLPPDQQRQLDRPSYRNLVQQPDHYRGYPRSDEPRPMVPIRLTVQVFHITKLVPGENLKSSSAWRYWGGEKPIWRLDGLNAPEGGPNPLEPISIFCAFEPKDLPKPDKIAADGSLEYVDLRAPVMKISGVLLKTYKEPDRRGVMTVYPVVLAWQADVQPTGIMSHFTNMSVIGFALAGMIVLILAFYFIRFMLKPKRRPSPGYREAMEKARVEADAEALADPDAAGQDVAPELKAAAESYLKEHKKDDE